MLTSYTTILTVRKKSVAVPINLYLGNEDLKLRKMVFLGEYRTIIPITTWLTFNFCINSMLFFSSNLFSFPS